MITINGEKGREEHPFTVSGDKFDVTDHADIHGKVVGESSPYTIELSNGMEFTPAAGGDQGSDNGGSDEAETKCRDLTGKYTMSHHEQAVNEVGPVHIEQTGCSGMMAVNGEEHPFTVSGDKFDVTDHADIHGKAVGESSPYTIELSNGMAFTPAAGGDEGSDNGGSDEAETKCRDLTGKYTMSHHGQAVNEVGPVHIEQTGCSGMMAVNGEEHSFTVSGDKFDVTDHADIHSKAVGESSPYTIELSNGM